MSGQEHKPATVERIERVQPDGLNPNAPAAPCWRVHGAGRCFDFDCQREAENLATAINGTHAYLLAALKEARGFVAEDRDGFVRCHTVPPHDPMTMASGEIEIVGEMDALLDRIDAALAVAEGREE